MVGYKIMTERLSHKNWIFSNTVYRTSDLTSKYEIFYFACVSKAGNGGIEEIV